ncbi:hypothetical protein BXZ70DRAFT_774375 [Cristinia sonorae]|uniref:Uncharacterized protein n=1 Tax=Cristinia sonorae TaxID=1940300 RepID=A0A8K0XS85_9AGAR|nr:hypothetical protein BXZ70DRAFT_774375 [Cristinia sonorae]
MASPACLSPLPPHVENVRYVLAAAAGAWTWDVVTSLPDTIRLTNLSPPDIVQIIARLLAGAFIFTALSLNVLSVDHCQTLAKAVGWLGTFTLSIQNIPFFFCARAVFHHNNPAILAFLVLFILSIGGTFVSPFFIHASHIGETRQCLVSTMEGWATGILCATAYTVIISVSVALQLGVDNGITCVRRTKGFILKRMKGDVSGLLATSGQAFLLPIVITSTVAAVITAIPSIPSPYRLLAVVISVAVQSSMISRIHTNIKLGLLFPPQAERLSTVRFRGNPELPISYGQNSMTVGGTDPPSVPGSIRITGSAERGRGKDTKITEGT